MAQYSFGTGLLWGTATSDAFGNALATPTPIQFGTLQEVSLDISFDAKELYGQSQFPVAVARGKGKVTGKAKFARVNGLLLNSLLFGQTLTSAGLGDYYDTTGTTIPATPFSITPTPPSSGTWVTDLGVVNANGVPLTHVTGTPTTGQYSVAAGVYTFASADTGTTVYISYQYSITSTTAKEVQVNNLVMGNAPYFRADVSYPYNGKAITITLPNCLASKFSLQTKLDDFMIPEFDFSAFASGAGSILTMATSE